MENKILNMISGGRTGDFIHQLFIPAILYNKYGIKTNLYIANIGDNFHYGLEEAYDQFKEIVDNQDYINSFKVYDNSTSIDVNLSSWRNSNVHTGWTQKLSQLYLGHDPDIKNFKIINCNSYYHEYSDSLVINRSSCSHRHGRMDVHEKLINQFSQSFFICTDEQDYNNYPLKDLVSPIFVKHMRDYYSIINSCKLFLGNLSAPMAVAYSLGKSLVCEFGATDFESYMLEVNYYDNVSWYNYNTFYSSPKLKDLNLEL